MASTTISSKEKWERAHLHLDKALGKEIELMRDILSSLHQEELSLLQQDMRQWKSTMKSRSSTVIELSKQRSKRMKATADLTKLAVLLQKREMLPHEEESSCSILSKLDQIFALLEKTNLQNCRNEVLFTQKRPQVNKCAYPHPLHRKRRRPSVATYQ